MKIPSVLFELANGETFEDYDRCIFFATHCFYGAKNLPPPPPPVARQYLLPVRCVSMADKDRFLKVFRVCLRPVFLRSFQNNLQFFFVVG